MVDFLREGVISHHKAFFHTMLATSRLPTGHKQGVWHHPVCCTRPVGLQATRASPPRAGGQGASAAPLAAAQLATRTCASVSTAGLGPFSPLGALTCMPGTLRMVFAHVTLVLIVVYGMMVFSPRSRLVRVPVSRGCRCRLIQYLTCGPPPNADPEVRPFIPPACGLGCSLLRPHGAGPAGWAVGQAGCRCHSSTHSTTHSTTHPVQ